LRNALIAYLGQGRQAVPDTAFSAAFMRALVRWAAKHNPETKIAIPTGIVTTSELAQVLRALGLLQTPKKGTTMSTKQRIANAKMQRAIRELVNYLEHDEFNYFLDCDCKGRTSGSPCGSRASGWGGRTRSTIRKLKSARPLTHACGARPATA
jgi:hypothetical protein